MDEIEFLRERNKQLTNMCQVLCELTSGMMKAAGEDNPELMEMPFYVDGQKRIEEMSLYLRKIEGEA